jgi:hypothetical protein
MGQRVTVLRSVKVSSLHLVHLAGAFDELPDPVRQMGPWIRLDDFDLRGLRPALRSMLAGQAFVVIEAHVLEVMRRLLVVGR